MANGVGEHVLVFREAARAVSELDLSRLRRRLVERLLFTLGPLNAVIERQTDIAAELGCDRSVLSLAFTQLEDAGIVRRAVDEGGAWGVVVNPKLARISSLSTDELHRLDKLFAKPPGEPFLVRSRKDVRSVFQVSA